MGPFQPNGVWLLIVICGWRNTGVSVLIFSVSLLRAFLFRYCRDSVSSLQPGRIHRHTHRHGINYTQGAWFVGSHSPPTGEPEVHPHSHPGRLHPPVAAEEIGKTMNGHKLLGRPISVHASSASVPDELHTVPGACRKRIHSMQEKHFSSRREPRKGYGRRNSPPPGRHGSRTEP